MRQLGDGLSGKHLTNVTVKSTRHPRNPAYGGTWPMGTACPALISELRRESPRLACLARLVYHEGAGGERAPRLLEDDFHVLAPSPDLQLL
jgi:hypothetical protein